MRLASNHKHQRRSDTLKSNMMSQLNCAMAIVEMTRSAPGMHGTAMGLGVGGGGGGELTTH